MAIQSSINNMIGTAGTVSALAQHLDEQKKANALSKINAKEKYMEEFVNTNEDIKKSVDETEALNQEIKDIDEEQAQIKAGEYTGPYRDKTTGRFTTKDTYIALGDARREKVQGILEAKEYEDNMIRARLNIQDERAKLLGIDKHDPKIQSLNSEEDKERVRKFRQGGNQ